jgi:hypothetical protein
VEHPRPPDRFEDADRAVDVGLVGRDRIGDRTWHRRACGEVDDRVGVLQQLVEQVTVEDRPHAQVDVDVLEVLAEPRRQVVDDGDLVDAIRCQQVADQVRADEPRPTRDHDLHRCPFPLAGC